MVNPPLATTAVGVVPVQRAGMAAGVNNTFRQVGIATGIAGLGAIFQSYYRPGGTSAQFIHGQTCRVDVQIAGACRSCSSRTRRRRLRPSRIWCRGKSDFVARAAR